MCEAEWDYITQLAAESVSKACFGVNTRDLKITKVF
jgi:hypothetical protein